jgi:predicted transcriptional regulator
MTRARRRPTNAEVEILRVLWARGPATVRDVARALGREDAYTTVLKLMQNMTEKRLVTRDESARTHVYAAARPAEQTKQALVADFVDRVFDGSVAQLVMQALAGANTTREELAEIRKLLNAKRGGRS